MRERNVKNGNVTNESGKVKGEGKAKGGGEEWEGGEREKDGEGEMADGEAEGECGGARVSVKMGR